MVNLLPKIMSYIAPHGCIAGGAVRDIVLGHTPKDYDVFIFEFGAFEKFVSQKGIFDKVPYLVDITITGYFAKRYTVYNTTLDGADIQIIWQEDFAKSSDLMGDYRIRACRRWARQSYNNVEQPNSDDVIHRFDYTINMMYYDNYSQIVIHPMAQEAMQTHQIIFNPTHCSAFDNPTAIVNHMMRRAFYLANKLDYMIPIITIESVFKKYVSGFSDYDWATLGQFNWWANENKS